VTIPSAQAQPPRFRPDALEAAASSALRRAGVPAPTAATEASIMVEADLCGVPSHGLVMLPKLLQALADGRAVPDADVAVVRDRGATCLLDGGRGPGRYVAARAMDAAVDKARLHGVGLCLARNTTHWGRAHSYASRAAGAGFIGACTTNAIPTMAVPGVLRAVLGNNPIAIGVPRRVLDEPVVLDFALSQAAFGKVATSHREGRRVPANWGVDAEGAPTDDPAAILASGLLLPIGEYKGIGLAVMMELLTAALADGPFGHEIARDDRSGLDPESSKLFLAIDVSAFVDRATFDERVEAMLVYLASIDAGSPLLAPGQRGWEARRAHLRDGIPLHVDIVRQLRAAGIELEATDA
jgi:LDH2 family malate/lactate/ureidoglycolate dehydrogenase